MSHSKHTKLTRALVNRNTLKKKVNYEPAICRQIRTIALQSIFFMYVVLIRSIVHISLSFKCLQSLCNQRLL